MRSQLFAIATVALSGVFTVLMFRSLKLVADAWFIGCVFHADGSKTCRWDVVWLPDPCLPPPPPPPPNTLGGTNGTLMHALFMSLAFGLLTPIGSISFTVRAAACAAAWPRALLLQQLGQAPSSWHQEPCRSPTTTLLACQTALAAWAPERGRGRGREREREREREGGSPCRSRAPVQTHRRSQHLPPIRRDAPAVALPGQGGARRAHDGSARPLRPRPTPAVVRPRWLGLGLGSGSGVSRTPNPNPDQVRPRWLLRRHG